jgi:hypothetical protein
MSKKPQTKSDRVGVFLQPDTRNRLNKVKADLSHETGRIVYLDDLVNMLLDRYEAAPKTNGHMLEAVR